MPGQRLERIAASFVIFRAIECRFDRGVETGINRTRKRSTRIDDRLFTRRPLLTKISTGGHGAFGPFVLYFSKLGIFRSLVTERGAPMEPVEERKKIKRVTV